MQAAVFFACMGMVAVGLWMERPSLAFIVPGVVGVSFIVVKYWIEGPAKPK